MEAFRKFKIGMAHRSLLKARMANYEGRHDLVVYYLNLAAVARRSIFVKE